VSWVVIAVLVAVAYVCLVTFVLALLRAAKRGDEQSYPAEAAAGKPRFAREEELELTPEDAAFLERLGRR
jgi:hypothetical protein